LELTIGAVEGPQSTNRHSPDATIANGPIANGMAQSPNPRIVNKSSILNPQSPMDAGGW
jgi:hypothetical protein